MQLTVPGLGELTINTLILDLNGTLAVDGHIVSGVEERINLIKEKGIHVVLFSGDTRGNAKRIADTLGMEFILAKNSQEKMIQGEKFGFDSTATIGNGLIDRELMQKVKLGIVTLQAEGVHTKTLEAAHLVVPSIIDALDLFLKEERLIASLRT